MGVGHHARKPNTRQELIAAAGVALASDFLFSTPASNCLFEGELTACYPNAGCGSNNYTI